MGNSSWQHTKLRVLCVNRSFTVERYSGELKTMFLYSLFKKKKPLNRLECDWEFRQRLRGCEPVIQQVELNWPLISSSYYYYYFAAVSTYLCLWVIFWLFNACDVFVRCFMFLFFCLLSVRVCFDFLSVLFSAWTRVQTWHPSWWSWHHYW